MKNHGSLASIFKGAMAVCAVAAVTAVAAVPANAVVYTYEFTLEPPTFPNQASQDAEAIIRNSLGGSNASYTNVDRIGVQQGDSGLGNFAEDSPFDSTALEAIDVIRIENPTGQRFDKYTWELKERTDDWNVVKIGVSVGSKTSYFLVDFDSFDVGGADADLVGFTLDDLFGLSSDLDYWRSGNSQNFQALDHISFFGVDAAGTTNVPEPGTLALLGVGLFGLGVMARRRRQAV